MSGYVYDTGVLIAAERNERLIWAVHRRILERGIRPVVPATVLAQAWRGGPQPHLSRFLRGCDVHDFTEAVGRAVGAVLRKTGSGDIVDAGVVVLAQRRRQDVITGDPGDLGAIAGALGRPAVVIHALGDLTSSGPN